jgi:hypothetical protein
MDTATAELVKESIEIDAIREFEKLEGGSYKEYDHEQNARMMASVLCCNAFKKLVLESNGDTHFGMSADEYIKVVTGFGFEQVFCEEFHCEKWNQHDKYFIFWHPLGLLLAFDTFGTFNGKTINGGKVYYNWCPSFERYGQYTSSGCWSGAVWTGDHDCREGLISNMVAMAGNGDFLPVWESQPRLWLLSYQDEKDCCSGPMHEWTHKQKTAERIACLPQHVQDAIKGR